MFDVGRPLNDLLKIKLIFQWCKNR